MPDERKRLKIRMNSRQPLWRVREPIHKLGIGFPGDVGVQSDVSDQCNFRIKYSCRGNDGGADWRRIGGTQEGSGGKSSCGTKACRTACGTTGRKSSKTCGKSSKTGCASGGSGCTPGAAHRRSAACRAQDFAARACRPRASGRAARGKARAAFGARDPQQCRTACREPGRAA
jgi:hypothetical protein